MIQTLLTFFGQSFSVKAYRRALLFSVLFSCACCNASTTLICRVLQSARVDGTVYAKKWVTYENGGMGGRAGDIMVYPFLADLESASGGGSYIQYWPQGYTASLAPYVYTVKPQNNLSLTIPDDRIEHISEILAALDSFSPNQSASINGVVIQYPEDGGVIVTPTHTKPGTVVGSAVSTYDKDGNAILAYPNQTGFVAGYQPTPQGDFVPVWYDTTGINTGYQATKLDSLNNTSQTQLTYDDATGQYSFNAPDYSAQLSAINQSINDINFNPEIILNPDITVESPQVTVNPEITVTPTVTVPPPQVTVEAPQVTVNPEITVTPTVNVPAPQVTIQNSSSNLLQNLSYTDPGFDPQVPNFTQEENELSSIMNGWATSVPGIGTELDGALNVVVGRIPTFGSSLNLGTIEVGPYTFAFNWERYASIIAWIRAACLFVLIIVFGIAVWNTVTQSLQI